MNSIKPCALGFEVTGSKDDKASFFDEVKKSFRQYKKVRKSNDGVIKQKV